MAHMIKQSSGKKIGDTDPMSAESRDGRKWMEAMEIDLSWETNRLTLREVVRALLLFSQTVCWGTRLHFKF